MIAPELKSPFPYFGGKSRAAHLIWERFGKVVNYVEPFFGSGAVLLQRPQPFDGTETVNDKDGMIANFFRALQSNPDHLAIYADNPVNENDLHARHIYLVNHREELTARLEGDPEYYDVKLAGWWVWGIACWIGGGWCSGKGPWQSIEDDQGNRQLVHLSNAGQGVKRQLVHLGNAGQGVKRKRVHLGNAGRGVNRKRAELIHYFNQLAFRLNDVRVCCGDWKRITGPSVTFKHELTAILLDPPYSNDERAEGLYAEDCGSVAAEAREWAIANGKNPLLRIALCGYETEHQMPADWESIKWHAPGGYDRLSHDVETIGKNRTKERIWFSPNCLKAEQSSLF